MQIHSPVACCGSGSCRVSKDMSQVCLRGAGCRAVCGVRDSWRAALKCRAVHITTAPMPKILCCERIGSVSHAKTLTFFRNNSADVNSYTDLYLFLRQVRKRESNPHFFCHLLKSTLSMATPVSMVHAVLPFREALLRDTYTRTHCHVNVLAFYSTLKESYSEL